jgi:hypothetical protein
MARSVLWRGHGAIVTVRRRLGRRKRPAVGFAVTVVVALAGPLATQTATPAAAQTPASAASPGSGGNPLGPTVKAPSPKAAPRPATPTLGTPTGPLIVGNNAAFGGGPIQTYDFSSGSLVNSFVPDGATSGPSNNGRAVAVVGNKVFYSELGGDGFGPSDAIHIALFNGGAGGSDIGTLPNPAPSVGIQDLDYAKGVLYALTGYLSGPLQAWKLDPTTGAVLAGPIAINSDPSADGFTVLPDGNFLVNSSDASCTYAEYSSVTGAPTGSSIAVPGGGQCTGVATDGTSLYFQTDFDSFTQTDLAGHLIARTSVASNLVEDVSLVSSPGAGLGTWMPAGPNFVTDTRSNIGYVDSGRVTALAPDPASEAMYVGTVGGGVWRLDTNSYTWTPVSDSAPSLSISALALANPPGAGAVLVAGTGEQSEPRSYGVGIMRGVVGSDGTVTWSLAAPLPGATVQQIVVAPQNPDLMLAATSAGLYMSTDGGSTWSQRLPGNFTGVAPDPSRSGSFLAAETSGADHSTCSARVWQADFFAAGPPFSSYQLPPAPAGPFNANVSLSASATQAFALISGCSGFYAQSLSFTAAGRSGSFHWQAFATSAFTGHGAASNLFGGQGAVVGQGEFDNVIAAVPGASCDVVMGGVGLYRVTSSLGPGGCSGKPTVTPLSQKMHEDMHALIFRNGALFVGNDGGLWSTPSLTTPAWTSWHGALAPNQSISTFYAGEATDASHLIGGVQDDGTPSTFASGSTRNWSQAGTGDGGYSYAWAGAPKYFEQDLGVYSGTNQIGECQISLQTFPYQCGGENSQFPDPPLLMDTLESSPQKLLFATSDVFLSTSGGGANGSGWTNSSGHASPPLTASPGYISSLGFTCGTDCPDYIAEATVDWKAFGGPKIFTASAFGAVRVATSTFIGQNWQDIGTGLPQPSPATKIPGLPWVSGLAINPCIWSASNNCGGNHEAWVALQENGRGAVFHTNDYTQSPPSWSAVGTFNTPVTSLAVVSTPNGDNNHVDLYIGTANEGVLTCGGCYGDNPHSNWSPAGSGLPNAWVSEISCSTDGKDLIAWTYGRGAWELAPPSSPTGCVSKEQSDTFG